MESDDFEECSIRNDVEDSDDYGRMVCLFLVYFYFIFLFIIVKSTNETLLAFSYFP